VDLQTIEICAEAGADVFVAGSAVYGADDPAAAVDGLREVALTHEQKGPRAHPPATPPARATTTS
jgi:3-keto-L-gulonate-6-phosphate decarboxylase